ncbi:MAG: AAA family ATPase, partial [Gammaproteobacteria bacterium]|nr:AAA family ATPase [Gammaproteobacteria bacterium]
MLTHLYIRNFVLVTETEIDFKQGMTVLSGETGAGKSIIFDALGLAIGKRAESRFIRQGAEQAEIVATFEQLTPELHSWMKQQALECSDDSLMLRRVIRQDGRSRAFINGSPSTTQLLRELSTLLIDIQGQHAHQRLLKREEQLHLLDQYGEHAKQLKKMAQQFQQWEALSRQQQQLLQS